MTRNGHDGTLTRLALGSAAGLAGTLAIGAVMTAEKKIVGGETSPIQQDPGEFIVKKAEQLLPRSTRQRIPEKAEKLAAQALGFQYGMAFGAAYALIRKKQGSIIADGAALGLINWAVGFLGWLPASGLAKPVWKHETRQIVASLAEHVAYGIVTVAAFKALEHIVETAKR